MAPTETLRRVYRDVNNLLTHPHRVEYLGHPQTVRDLCVLTRTKHLRYRHDLLYPLALAAVNLGSIRSGVTDRLRVYRISNILYDIW